MLVLLAAAVVSLPVADITTVRAVLRDPGLTIRDPVAGARIRAFVDEEGKVQSCAVISFAGSRESANELCSAYRGKKVRPAADIDGAPISAFMETVIWYTPSADTAVPALPDRPPDAQLAVQRLPDGLSSPFRITIGLVIDEGGAVAACGPISAAQEAMATAACQAIEGETFAIVEGRRDEAIRYARPYDVEFSVSTGVPSGA